MFFHRWSHFRTQISVPWFQKRDQFSSLIPQMWYSLIPDPYKKLLIPIPWSVIPDPRAVVLDPTLLIPDPTPLIPDPGHIPRYDPVMRSLLYGCAWHFITWKVSRGGLGWMKQFTRQHTKLSSFIPHKKFIAHPGGTPLYRLYWYVRRQRVWFLSIYGLK